MSPSDQSIAAKVETFRAKGDRGDGGFAVLARRLASGEDVSGEVISDVLAKAERTAEELEETVEALLATYARTALHAELPERERLLREAEVELEAVEAQHRHATETYTKLHATASERLAEARAAVAEAKAAGATE